MSQFPAAIDELAAALGDLPGIGKRTAERLALALLDWDPQRLTHLAEQLASLQERVRHCTTCGNLSEGETCRVCADPSRRHSLVCVVENARQIAPVEKSGRYRGTYHVLGGKVSPLDGVDFDSLNAASLFSRVPAEEVTEIVIATSPDVEGEATATYLAEELRSRFPDLIVSRIATGVPVGADLTFADAATMATAIDSRRQF
jgi:recombination protein RecR